MQIIRIEINEINEMTIFSKSLLTIEAKILRRFIHFEVRIENLGQLKKNLAYTLNNNLKISNSMARGKVRNLSKNLNFSKFTVIFEKKIGVVTILPKKMIDERSLITKTNRSFWFTSENQSGSKRPSVTTEGVNISLKFVTDVDFSMQLIDMKFSSKTKRAGPKFSSFEQTTAKKSGSNDHIWLNDSVEISSGESSCRKRADTFSHKVNTQ